MPSVAIVTDSTMYLPPPLVQSLGIEQISLYYDLGDGPRRELDSEGDFSRFYADLLASSEVATTSPPSLEDFTAVYQRMLADSAGVVSIHLSSGISDTCTIAREAAAALSTGDASGERIVVIDSAGACGHLGVQVMAAARAAAAGEDAQGVVERVRQARQQVKMWFLFETLEYLRRGGRIGSAAAWIGSALDIKPILTIESELTAVERVRTRSTAVSSDSIVRIGLMSSADPIHAAALPIRPPRRRYSSVSNRNHILTCWRAWRTRSTTPCASSPAAAARAAAITCTPRCPQAPAESITTIRSPLASPVLKAAAASRAIVHVSEIPDER